MWFENLWFNSPKYTTTRDSSPAIPTTDSSPAIPIPTSIPIPTPISTADNTNIFTSEPSEIDTNDDKENLLFIQSEQIRELKDQYKKLNEQVKKDYGTHKDVLSDHNTYKHTELDKIIKNNKIEIDFNKMNDTIRDIRLNAMDSNLKNNYLTKKQHNLKIDSAIDNINKKYESLTDIVRVKQSLINSKYE